MVMEEKSNKPKNFDTCKVFMTIANGKTANT
jgi:hypothetical protein